MMWKKSRRADGRMEWQCEHGIGHGNHPHGCDGCCRDESYPGRGYIEGPDVWETLDGRRIRVKDMDDNHLMNCIKYLRKNVNKYKEAVLFRIKLGLVDEERVIYESAVDEIESMDDETFLKRFSSPYGYMLKEVVKRGLMIHGNLIDNTPPPDPREFVDEDVLGQWRLK